MSKKYVASNTNVPPPEVRVERWASVTEAMVSIGLVLALLTYLLLPAMLGEHVFKTVAEGTRSPLATAAVDITLTQADARGLFWLSALSMSLAGYAALYFLIWSGVSALPMPNFRYLVASGMLISVASGDIVRMASSRTPLPEGAEVPVVFMSQFVDIPGIASSGFLQGLQYSAIAPFTLVGVVGVIFALYRIGKSRLERKLEAQRQGRRR